MWLDLVLWERGLPAKAVLQAAKFLGKVVGSFLQFLSVSMNWYASSRIDSLGWSLQIQ
ncbi:hypothetical protein EMIT0P100_40267 [Pseudomonas sp. IT-P100]